MSLFSYISAMVLNFPKLQIAFTRNTLIVTDIYGIALFYLEFKFIYKKRTTEICKDTKFSKS